jgi:hypothetical protein
MLLRSSMRQLIAWSLVAVGLIIFGWKAAESRVGGQGVSRPSQSAVRCGHWSVYHVSHALGFPCSLERVQLELPLGQRGHSLLQLSDYLTSVGFIVSPMKQTLDSLAAGSFPCIAHFRNPDHFVVVTKIEGRWVHYFDCSGNRRSARLDEFESRWTGFAMWVSRPPDEGQAERVCDGPSVQFDKLIAELGSVASAGDPIAVEYRFSNRGIDDLAVQVIGTDCNCFSAEVIPPVLGPGEHGVVRAVYSPIPIKGTFTRELTLSTNDPRVPNLSLRACGFSDMGVAVTPEKIALGSVTAGHEVSFQLTVTNQSEDDSIELLSVEPSWGAARVQVLSPDANRSRFAKQAFRRRRLSDAFGIETVVAVSFIPGIALLGHQNEEIIIRTSSKDYPSISVPLSMKVMDLVQTYPQVLPVRAGQELDAYVRVKLVGSSLRLDDVVAMRDGVMLAPFTDPDGSLVIHVQSDEMHLDGDEVPLEIFVRDELRGTEHVRMIPIIVWN